MRYHDTKPPYFATQYRLHSHAPQFKKNMHYFFFFKKELELYNLINRRKKIVCGFGFSMVCLCSSKSFASLFFQLHTPKCLRLKYGTDPLKMTY